MNLWIRKFNRDLGLWCYHKIFAVITVAIVLALWNYGLLIRFLDADLFVIGWAVRGAGHLIGLIPLAPFQWIGAGITGFASFYQDSWIVWLKNTQQWHQGIPGWAAIAAYAIEKIFGGQQIETILRLPEILLFYAVHKRVLRFTVWLIRGCPSPRDVVVIRVPAGPNVVRLRDAA